MLAMMLLMLVVGYLVVIDVLVCVLVLVIMATMFFVFVLLSCCACDCVFLLCMFACSFSYKLCVLALAVRQCAILICLPLNILFFLVVLFAIGAMSLHQGGVTKKMSVDLYDINKQLKSGRTRKGKYLTVGVRVALEEQRLAILARMQEAKDAQHDERMNAIKNHTSRVGAANVAELKSHMTMCISPLVKLFVCDELDNPEDRIRSRRLQICASNVANQRDRSLVRKNKAVAKAKAIADRKLIKDKKAKAKILGTVKAKVGRSLVEKTKMQAGRLITGQTKTIAKSCSPSLPVGSSLASADSFDEHGVEDDSDSDSDYDPDELLTRYPARERERWSVQQVMYFLTGVLRCGPPQNEKLGIPLRSCIEKNAISIAPWESSLMGLR